MEKTQLDRIEEKVDDVCAVVNQHVGIMSVARWVVGGIGASLTAAISLLAYVGLHK